MHNKHQHSSNIEGAIAKSLPKFIGISILDLWIYRTPDRECIHNEIKKKRKEKNIALTFL